MYNRKSIKITYVILCDEITPFQVNGSSQKWNITQLNTRVYLYRFMMTGLDIYTEINIYPRNVILIPTVIL